MAYILAFLKYVIYGSSVFFTSELEENVDVLDILALRFLMSFAVMWLLKISGILKIRIGIREILSRGERHSYIKLLFLAALFEPILYMFFETVGILMTTNITTAVILSLAPISSCIGEALLLKEKNTLAEKIFLGAGIVGVIYIAVNTSSGGGKDTPIGILFLVLAVISGTLFGVFSRKSSSHFKPMEITYVSAALGALIFNAVNVVRHLFAGDILHYFDPYLSVNNLIGFFFLAVISAVIATGMNNYCYSRMQISTMAAFSGVSTLVTIIIGAVFRDERLYYFHFIGLSLIILRMVGVSCISIMRDKKREKANAEIASVAENTEYIKK